MTNEIAQRAEHTPAHIQEAESSSRAIAEVQSAMAIAKRFPRDEVAAIDRIKASCARPTLAAKALYSYARGGSEITGPSIRLAEAVAQQWGNLTYGVREIEQRGGESTVEAFAHDLQTNVRVVKVFQVRHERHTKRGVIRLEDSRDVYELVANQGARRLRACILGVVPGDVIEEAVEACEATLTAKAEATPERIAGMIEKFKEIGVTRAQIEKRVQRRVESITPTLLLSLGKIYNSIKDGMSAAADWFEVEQAPETKAKSAAAVAAALKPRVVEDTPFTVPAPAQAEADGGAS